MSLPCCWLQPVKSNIDSAAGSQQCLLKSAQMKGNAVAMIA
jgi:hypothetical protein